MHKILTKAKKAFYYTVINNKKMDSNNELKEIGFKTRTCYYLDHIININDLELDNILSDKKPFGNFLIYDVAYKTPDGTKPLRIIFNKVGGYIKKYDGK